MGLSLSYTLTAPTSTDESAVRKMTEQTAEVAKALGCKIAYEPHNGGPDHWKMRDLPDGSSTGDPVEPLTGWSTIIVPGEGCEPAFFGLCRYPEIDHWTLTSWCKTQYAAQHGIEHFIASHLRIIHLLDLWREFGVETKVCDEGEYWETRSIKRLQERLATYDRLVAAVAGAVKDDVGDGTGVTGEIFKDERFEKLEAEGRKQFAEQIEEARRRISEELK